MYEQSQHGRQDVRYLNQTLSLDICIVRYWPQPPSKLPLDAAVNYHLEEPWLVGRESFNISGFELGRGFNPLTRHAERLCKRGELNRRIDKIHADEAVGAVEQLQP